MDALFPWFQPILETASGKIAGYEALARTRDANGEVVSAGGVFQDKRFDTSERLRLDRIVRYQALEKLTSLPEGTYLSINLSPQWLTYTEQGQRLKTLDMIADLGVDPSRIMLEITELAGDLSQIERAVGRYREAGFKIAIDDFGADFSQLDRITHLRPDVIKLDMKLLHDGLNNRRHASITQMLGEMASKLGAKVLCEGVETEEAFYLALSCNAFYTQGFLFAPAVAEPQPVEQFRERLHQMRDNYRDMAVDHITRTHWQADRVTAELVALRDLIRASGENLDLEHFFPTAHMSRFYICDRDGNQISANYENSDGSWIRDERARGLNWSWRPYFFELLGAEDIGSRLVFSEPYHDIYHGKLSQTAALLIDNNRILLADMIGEAFANPLFPYSQGMSARSVQTV